MAKNTKISKIKETEETVGSSVDLTSEVTGVLPIANGGTNSNTASDARTALGVDAAGTDNSTNVTLTGTPDYITISGQEITRNQIDLANDVTGTLPVGNGGTGATTLTSNSILTGNGTSAIQAEANLTFDSSSGSLQAQHSAIPLITLKRTSTGSDNDNVGTIRFTGNDDADNAIRYGVISAKIIDASDGAEEGQLNLAVASHDGEEVTGLSITSGDAEDEVDVSIANGTSSVTTVAGTLTMGSTATLDNSGNLLTNAATATALTSGDKTIEGNLRIGGTGDTSNNFISIDAQNGDDSSGGGITFYETGTYSASAPQYGAKIVYNEDDDELAIGTMHNNTFMRQIHMDRGSQQVLMQNIKLQTDSTNGPYVFFLKTDTSVADGDSLARIIVRNDDRGSSTNNSQIQWFATEDHDSNSCGTKINFTVTPNGNSQSETVAMTINQDSSISIPGTIDLGGTGDTVISKSDPEIVKIGSNTIVTTRTTTITSNGGDEPIATMIGRRTLTTAECNALHTTPIEIVPAPGANIVALPTGGMIRVDRAATNTNAGSLNFHYESLEPGTFGTDAIIHLRRFHNGFTTDGVYNLGGSMPNSGLMANSLTEDVNKAIEVSVDSAFTTDCFTSVDIYLTYQLIKIA